MRGYPRSASLILAVVANLALGSWAHAQARPPAPAATPLPAVIDLAPDADAESTAIVEQRLLGNQLDASNVTASAVIDSSFVSANGVVLINQAPASLVNQANIFVLSASNGSSSVATALAAGDQEIRDNRVTQRGGRYETRISGQSFAGGAGYVGINQAAGPLTNQLNVLAISISSNVAISLADDDLGQVSTNNQVSAEVGVPRTTRIEDGAFDGFVGIVQINQSSGANVNSANVLGVGVGVNALGLGVLAP